MSQSELLARLRDVGLRLSRSTLVKIEHGQRAVTVDEVARFALVLDVPPLRLLVADEDVVLVAGEPVPIWHFVAWFVGEEPCPSQDAGRYAEASAPLQMRSEVRAQVGRAAAALQRRALGDDQGVRDELHAAFRTLQRRVREYEQRGLPTAGLIPPWLSSEYSAWRDALPTWTTAGFVDDDGTAQGHIYNRLGERGRDVTWQNDDRED